MDRSWRTRYKPRTLFSKPMSKTAKKDYFMADVKQLLLLPGDGVGPEVMAQVIGVADWFNAKRGTNFNIEQDAVGGAAYDRYGVPLADETLEKAKAADAVILGAVGGPAYDGLPHDKRPERGLLAIRKELDLFGNLRPAVTFPALAGASSLKEELVSGLDILIVRELVGGIYFGEPRGIDTLPDGSQRGYNTQVYTTSEIERVARVALELARKRNNRVCSVEKENVMESGKLWRAVVTDLHKSAFDDVELSHMYADNCAMQLVRAPKQFDVIVTDNLFGDLLSDCAAMLTGSLGMLPSASLGTKDKKTGRVPSMYEPVHGSAPDIAGQNLANPLATILSFGMMLRYSFDLGAESDLLDKAVAHVLHSGIRTSDIYSEGCRRVGTDGMGAAVLSALDEFV